jgi:hypothetical protein
VRVRGAGYKVLRIAEEMTLHDAAITRFAQWWTRSVRGGHSFAEGMAMHGSGESRHNVRHTLSALFYGLALPALWCGSLLFAASGLFFFPLGIGVGPLVLVAVGVPAAYLRAAFGAYRDRRRRQDPRAHAALYAAFCMLGKVPETIGILTYVGNRLRGRYSGLMEYKSAPVNAGGAASGGAASGGAMSAGVPGVASRNSSVGVTNGASRNHGNVPPNGMTEPC